MFRKLAHLLEQLGEERFGVLISSDNTGKVKAFCDQLIKDSIPIKMTIGGRIYEILSYLHNSENSVDGHTMIERAKEMNAHLGQDDAQHLLNHQQDIPTSLQGGMTFVFTDWRDPDCPDDICFVFWHKDRWIQSWRQLNYGVWYGSGVVLRRKR